MLADGNSPKFSNGHGIFGDYVDATETASNRDCEQRNRFENVNP